MYGIDFRNTRIGLVCVCAFALPLGGCVAAAIPLMTAATLGTTAWGGLKLYQSASGSEIGIAFEDERIAADAQSYVQAADVIGFWASLDTTLISTAERIEAAGLFNTVITPSRGASFIQSHNLPTDVKLLTSGERESAFRSYANAVGADLVVALSELGVERDTNILSLSRAQARYQHQLFIYSAAADREIFKGRMITRLGMGSDLPSADEIESVIGQAIADRIASLHQGSAFES